VLINLDPAGDIGHRSYDIELLGHCDEIVREICRELDWEGDLDRLWAATADTVDETYRPLLHEQSAATEGAAVGDTGRLNSQSHSKPTTKRDVIQELAEKVEATLKLDESEIASSSNEMPTDSKTNHPTSDNSIPKKSSNDDDLRAPDEASDIK